MIASIQCYSSHNFTPRYVTMHFKNKTSNTICLLEKSWEDGNYAQKY